MCAGGPRALLDLDGWRAPLAAAAGRAWDTWQDISARFPPPQPMSVYWARHLDDPAAYAPQDASDDFGRQPAVGAYRTWWLHNDRRGDPRVWAMPGFDPLIEFAGSGGRAGYIARITAAEPFPDDLLTLDGWWVPSDGDPAHGACDGPFPCPHEPPVRREGIVAHLDRLAGDVLVVRLRCRV